MGEMNHIVVLTLDEQRYALRLSAVERIVRAVEVTALPQAPEGVLGVVNVEGRVIPVVNIRQRFNLPEQEINLDDQLIIARTSRRDVARDRESSVVHGMPGVAIRLGAAAYVLPLDSIAPTLTRLVKKGNAQGLTG